MIPKYRMWNEIISRLYSVDGLYFDREVAQYKDEVGVSRLIKFQNAILMQSTGLHDKNGKEIFEGDVLGVDTDEEIVNLNIYWDSKHALFMFESKKYNEKDLLAELVEDNTYPFEILGNIYENPELLEVTE